MGDPDRPPEEHPKFEKLDWDRRKELTALWRENKAKRMCRKGCGRAKVAGWEFCRSCTRCADCGATPDGGGKFYTRSGRIECAKCHDGTGKDS